MLTLFSNAVGRHLCRRCPPLAVPAIMAAVLAITAAVRMGVVVRWRELQWQRANRPAVPLEPQRTWVHGRPDKITTTDADFPAGLNELCCD